MCAKIKSDYRILVKKVVFLFAIKNNSIIFALSIKQTSHEVFRITQAS